MAEEKITLQIRAADGSHEHVRLADFNKEVDAVARALEQADIVFSGRGQRTTEFRVVDLHHSAATIVIGAEPIEPEIDARPAIIAGLFKGIQEIATTGRMPRRFSADLIEPLRDLVTPIGSGVAESLLSWGDQTVTISVEFKKRIHDLHVPDETEEGEIDGMMEMINVHNQRNTFRLYPIIGPDTVACRFKDDALPKVKEGFGQYVNVAGEVHYRYGAKHPYRIDVKAIEIFPEEDDLPTWADLRGVAPDATGGEASEVFVRRIRDEWH